MCRVCVKEGVCVCVCVCVSVLMSVNKKKESCLFVHNCTVTSTHTLYISSMSDISSLGIVVLIFYICSYMNVYALAFMYCAFGMNCAFTFFTIVHFMSSYTHVNLPILICRSRGCMSDWAAYYALLIRNEKILSQLIVLV
jgi:hypothetical protein